MKHTALLAAVMACILCLSPAALASETADASAAPVAENQQLETYRGVSVGGRLTACDPDGGTLTYKLTTPPMKGSVEISEDGVFVYTPDEGKRGRDYFGFRAQDPDGNLSQEATVIIRLCRQKTAVTYSDLQGAGCEYAAVALAEAGIFVGEQVGGQYVFHPQDDLSRGEFLSMCMVLGGEDVLAGVSNTGFLDDGDIDRWLKPYISTALLRGYVNGTAVAGGAKFCADDAVLLKDACVMLDAVMNVTDVVSASAYVGQEASLNGWAQAVANLAACQVLDTDYAGLSEPVTRADAAVMLANALVVMNAQ